MLMAYGLFVFDMPTIPFQDRERHTDWRWPEQSRIGARAGTQFLGPGRDEYRLSGVLMPELTGGEMSLEALRLMAAAGMAWPLIDPGGLNLGLYVLDSVDERGTYLMDGGKAQRIDFVLHLRRVDDWIDAAIGRLSDAIINLF